jgi:hypothetical protein
MRLYVNGNINNLCNLLTKHNILTTTPTHIIYSCEGIYEIHSINGDEYIYKYLEEEQIDDKSISILGYDTIITTFPKGYVEKVYTIPFNHTIIDYIIITYQVSVHCILTVEIHNGDIINHYFEFRNIYTELVNDIVSFLNC